MRLILAAGMASLLGSSLLLAHGAKPWLVPTRAKKRRNPVAATAESVKAGALLYRDHCLVCHSATGDGNGPWVEKLATKPKDFTDRGVMNAMTDGEIFWKISKGRGEMPRFDNKLSERQRWQLVNYLRTLASAGGDRR